MATILTPAATLIADRGGANPGYANDPAKLHACNRWVDHARPIIKAMFVLDDAAMHPLTEARLADPTGYASWGKRSAAATDYAEAQDYITAARKELAEMLDGIRGVYVGDECPGLQDDDATQDEADDFSDWLRASTISVDAAIALVTDEHNAAFWEKAA